MNNNFTKQLRRTINGLACTLVLCAMVACEQKETIFQGPYHVRFTRPDTAARESYKEVLNISVHHVGPQLAQPITVTYVIGGSAREGVDYRILGTKGTVVIPANQSFGYIKMQLINNANNILESQDVVFTLTEVAPATLRVGFGNEEAGRTVRFTILDDCILSGTYTGTTPDVTPSPLRPGIAISSTNCREYTLSNWNIGLFGLNAVKPTLIFVDNGDNSLTIPAQVNSNLASPRDTIQGTGFINPLDQSITLSIQLAVLSSQEKDSTVVYTIALRPE